MTKYDCLWHQVDDPSPRERRLITVSNGFCARETVPFAEWDSQ